MRCVSGPKLWLMAMALAGGSLPCAGAPREAGSGAGPPTAVARSALAILEAAAAPAGVTLRLRRAADQTPLPATAVTVSVAGRNAPATASADGSWFAPLPTAVGAGDTLEVVVAHDGIRELLSARFAAPGARDAGGGAAAADTLVAPVRALVVTVDGNSGDSVGRQASGAGVDPVRGACMHVGYDLEARPRRGDRILQRLFHLGVQRRRRVAAPIRGAVGNLPVVGDVADRDLRIIQDLDQLLADFFLRMPGEDPAVHVGGRALRQRVIGVTPLEPRGDTGRVQNARDGRDLHEPLEGLAVGRVRENAPVVRGFLAGRLCGHALEIAARDVVELEREAELLESQEPRGELVDRVVGSRLRAVAAPVGDGQLVVAVHLLGGAQLEYLGHAVLGSDRVSVVVQHELGIDELPVIPDEPVDAVAAAPLLVLRERKNDVATRAKTLVLHPQQRRRLAHPQSQGAHR